MDQTQFNEGLLRYLEASPTPFHAVAEAGTLLDTAGFMALDERNPWTLTPGGRYYVTRNGSALIAFALGHTPAANSGLCLVGAHTDSPGLRIKPNAEIASHGYWQLGVEVYGGALLNPWFDRDLGLAGRLSLRLPDGKLASHLIDIREPVACIPSLAIHLDREANDKRSINRQTQLPAIVARMGGAAFDLRTELLAYLAGFEPALVAASVLDYELALVDLQPPGLVGWRGEFIASARLDNLLSCYTAIHALCAGGAPNNRLIVLNDHEEVGSGSTAGARGTFLRAVLERICGSGEAFSRAIETGLKCARHPRRVAVYCIVLYGTTQLKQQRQALVATVGPAVSACARNASLHIHRLVSPDSCRYAHRFTNALCESRIRRVVAV